LAVLLLAAGCTTNAPAPPEPLVGAWRSSVEFQTGPYAGVENIELMYAFHADGTMTESSNYDAAPPVPPAYGAWRPVGSRVYEAKYEFFPTTPTDGDAFQKGGGWLPAGRGVLTERITVSPDNRTFTSTLRLEMLDMQGRPADGNGEAVGRAERIGF
jgi:hypothetical protein